MKRLTDVDLRHVYRYRRDADAFMATVISRRPSEQYHLIVAGATGLHAIACVYAICLISSPDVLMTTAFLTLMTLRMNVLARKAAHYRSDIHLAAAGAGMYIKTYDTQRVPYSQQ